MIVLHFIIKLHTFYTRFWESTRITHGKNYWRYGGLELEKDGEFC